MRQEQAGRARGEPRGTGEAAVRRRCGRRSVDAGGADVDGDATMEEHAPGGADGTRQSSVERKESETIEVASEALEMMKTCDSNGRGRHKVTRRKMRAQPARARRRGREQRAAHR